VLSLVWKVLLCSASCVAQSVREQSTLTARQPALRDYQLIGITWLLAMYDLQAGCILADEPALGKKVEVIGYLAELASSRKVWRPHLVVTPTGCLPQWRSEFERWLPSSKTCVYYGVSSYSRQQHWRDRKPVSFVWLLVNLVLLSSSVIVLNAVSSAWTLQKCFSPKAFHPCFLWPWPLIYEI